MEDYTMNISLAVYSIKEDDEDSSVIQAVIDGKEWSVPMDPRNRHYKEILRQTEAKTLVVQEAKE